MATQTPITFVGTFPNVTGLTQLKNGDTLAGVVNHGDFSPNSLMFSDAAGTVAAVVIPEDTVLGNTGSGITSLTMATLAPLVARELSIDDLFTTSGLRTGDMVAYNALTGSWFNQPNSLGNLTDVTADYASVGDFLVYSTDGWVSQDGPPVDGNIYGYRNGGWVRMPVGGSGGSGGGGTDHSALANLLEDTHPQYLTEVRGDARYYRQVELDSFLANKAAAYHQHVLADITDAGSLAGKSSVTETELADGAVSSEKISGAGSVAGQILVSSGAGSAPAWENVPEGAAITVTANSTGVKNFFVATTNWRITGWYLVATEASTNLTLDVYKSSGVVPTSAQTIVGTEPPSLDNQQLASDLELTTWTELDVSVGDVIGIEVTSTNAISELATLSLVGYRI